jgi:hypothetical protein
MATEHHAREGHLDSEQGLMLMVIVIVLLGTLAVLIVTS